MCATTVVGSYKGSAGVEDKRPIVNVRPREGRVGRALWAQAVCVWQRWWRQGCMLSVIIDNDDFYLVFKLRKLRIVHSREIHIGRAVFQIILISPWFCTQRILSWPEIQPWPTQNYSDTRLENCYVICKYVFYLAFSLSWFKNWSLVEFKCLHCSGASHKDQETWSDLILLFINTWRKRVGMGKMSTLFEKM